MTLLHEYHAVLNEDDCESRCMTEMRGRCLAVSLCYGACRLYDKPWEQRAVSYQLEPHTFPSDMAIMSVLVGKYRNMHVKVVM